MLVYGRGHLAADLLDESPCLHLQRDTVLPCAKYTFNYGTNQHNFFVSLLVISRSFEYKITINLNFLELSIKRCAESFCTKAGGGCGRRVAGTA